MNQKETANVAASATNTAAGAPPPAIHETSPKHNAPIGIVPYDEASITPLASGSASRRARSGTAESRAGTKISPASSSRNAQT